MKAYVSGSDLSQGEERRRFSSVLSFFSKQESGSYLVWRGESRSESELPATRKGEGRRCNERVVTLSRPEAIVIYARPGRSHSDEWWRPATIGGIFPLGELGVGVIVLSNLAIAGSL